MRYFETITFAAYVLGTFRIAAEWPALRSEAVLDPSHPALSVVLYFSVAVIIAIGIVLLISRAGSRIAMWAYIGVTAFGVPLTLRDVLKFDTPLNSAIIVIQTIAEVGAIAFLFEPSARAWMRGNRRRSEFEAPNGAL